MADLAMTVPRVDDHATLREVVETLAPLDKRAGSPGEREAAQWIAERLRRAGAPASVEEEPFLDGYARELLPLAVASALAGGLALSGRARRAAAAVAGLAAAAIADDVSNGPRVWRRAVGRTRPTWNVVAQAGDPAGERTLVVLAHHDAAPTGRVFDQSGQRWLAERYPGIVERMDTSLPLWWPVTAGPALVALGAAGGRRGVAAAGTALSLLATAVGADVARSPVVPGANDNLSAVAALVALAERLRERPIPGLRVWLVSCGAEEVLQGGIYGFAARHFPGLDRERTWVLNLDTIGSPELVLIEGEGPFVMEDYFDRRFRDLIARAAERAGHPLRRGLRARSSSDSVIPSRAGYPTAMLCSIDRHKCLSNYHQMSDTPENLDYDTVARAVVVTEAVGRELAGAA
jgi:acetylornithine deacetylase/succinyl-diaminopimelate desuccinylase-like protein